MAREIWLGPVLNRNRERLIARCRAMLRSGRGHEFIYLAATKPLMELVSARLLEGEIAGTIDQLNVYLLSGFSRRVFARARFGDTNEPIPYFAPIDTDLRPVQRPLFSRLMARLSEAGEIESFGQLARSDGVVSSIVGLVAEIQRAGKTAEEFRAIVRRREALDAESAPAPEAREVPETAEDAAEAKRIASIDYDRDTATVYERYERLLDDFKLTDASRDYLRALQVLQGEFLTRPVRVPFVDEARLLVIDGFFDILPVHAELLALLVRRFPESIVNLNFDHRNPSAYVAFRDVVERFGERSGFEEQYSTECVDVATDLHPLRTDLFNPEIDPPPPVAEPHVVDDSAATLLLAPDRLREVRAVAGRIKRLVFDEGFAPHEIAVVFRSRDRYEPLIRQVFRDETISISLGERRALTDLPAARAAMKVLDAALSNRSREGRQIRVGRIVALLKSDYFALGSTIEPPVDQPELPFDAPLGPDPRDLTLAPDEVENAVAFVGSELNLDDWLRRAHGLIARLGGLLDARVQDLAAAEGATGEDGDAPAKTKVARARLDFPIETLRRAAGIVEETGRIVLSIPYEAPAAEMAAAFRSALAALGFEPRLLAAAREAALDEADLRRAALDLRGVEGLRRAVDAVVEAGRLAASVETPTREVGDTRITRGEFRGDLQRAMEAHEMLVETETEGAVRVLGATDMRGMSFAAVFVLGLIEGEFPERTRGDWIFPQHERDNFREVGLPLEDISPEESLRNEEHYFYQAVCRATQKLYLCRPLGGDDESDTIPSYFIAEVERATGGRLAVETVSAGFDAENMLDATTPAELARSVVRARSAFRTGSLAPSVSLPVLGALERFASQRRPGQSAILSPSVSRRMGIEWTRETEGFDEYDGLLRNDLLRRMLASAYERHTFSASELNDFGDCGFRYFLKRVLGLTPRVEAALDLQALETGVLLHDALRRFLERYRGRSIAEVDALELRAALDASCAEVFDSFERRLPPLNPKLWKIERRMLAIVLERVLADEIELQRRLARSGVVPTYFELAFGMPNVDADPHSSPEPLVLERDADDLGSETISLRGQIDRVDVSPDGRLVAYDYKTSQGPRLGDMREGRDLQLGIYLAAVEHLFAREGEELAGGGYYALRPIAARRNNGLYRSDLIGYTDIRPTCSSNLTDDAWTALRRTIHENIWIAFDRIRDGDFRVVPSLDETTCARCDYVRVCRFERHRIRAKRSVDKIGSSRPLRPIDRRPGRPAAASDGVG